MKPRNPRVQIRLSEEASEACHRINQAAGSQRSFTDIANQAILAYLAHHETNYPE